MIEPKYTYDDVLIVPRLSYIESREEVDLTTFLGNLELKLPIFSANMDTVTGPDMSLAMGEEGAAGILHRFLSIEDSYREVIELRKKRCSMIIPSIGANGDYKERAQALIGTGVLSAICIDIAHGHSLMMERAIQTVRKLNEYIPIIAGNICTPEGFDFLINAGANIVCCGIGNGAVCSTREKTGHGYPQLSAILNIRKHALNQGSLIADGGIKTSGDIVKALFAGADAVMTGSLFAGTEETPLVNGHRGTYRGNASRCAQENFKGKAVFVEGIAAKVPLKGSVIRVLKELKAGIKSGFSYAGCRNIEDVRKINHKFISLTSSGLVESKTRL